MVTITDAEVADALHTTVAELPTGYESDIDSAEIVVGAQVEPYASNPDLVKRVAIYVACAFIEGSEDAYAVKQVRRESATLSFGVDQTSEASRDFWMRAVAVDPTGRLGRSTTTIGFETF